MRNTDKKKNSNNNEEVDDDGGEDIIIIIIPVITFMQAIYSYVPETNSVSTVYSVAAVLYLQSLPHVMLFRPCNMFCTFYISTSRSLCAVPNVAVFCSTLISCFPGTLLRYCGSCFESVPVAPVITGITFALTFHMRRISFMKFLYYYYCYY